ncbi:MAG: HAD family hydrolase [Solirubrobacterales bacterium]|nr:HAD family hydrolase [Solirubrobacterales bacterium]
MTAARRPNGRRPERIACRAVLLDAGGVIVLPDRGLVAGTLARIGVGVDPSVVPRAHYRAVCRLDHDVCAGAPSHGYVPLFCRALGVPAERLSDAVEAISRVADRSRSGAILWSEPAPYAKSTIAALGRVGIAAVIVTNSDGHAASNLRDAGVCDTRPGAAVLVTDVIDSGRVGSEKPAPDIFRAALRRAGVEAREAVHVGDMLSADIAGARAAGIVPIHLDPYRTCRAGDHRHVRWLNGVWRHIVWGNST